MGRLQNRIGGLVATVACVLALSGPARAQVLKESSTGVTFKVHRDIQGKPYSCIGTGLRKVYVFFKVYAAVVCVGDETGKPSFQQLLASVGGNLNALRYSKQFYGWFITGDFGKAMEWVFVRDLEKGKMVSTIRESLERELGDLNAPDVREPAQKFLAAMDVPLKKWQRVIVIERPGWEIIATLDGRPIVKVKSRKIAQAIWRIYFGPNPIQSNLKKELVEHIEYLR